MATATKEKATDSFNKNELIKIVIGNLKKKNPVKDFKPKEVEEEMNAKIDRMMEKEGGAMAIEIGAALANVYGEVPLHYSFDRYRPFSAKEIKQHNLAGFSQRELTKSLNKVRSTERLEGKKEWEVKRRTEIVMFRKYFERYLQETRGGHLENKLGVKVGVGDDITLNKGHYHKIY